MVQGDKYYLIGNMPFKFTEMKQDANGVTIFMNDKKDVVFQIATKTLNDNRGMVEEKVIKDNDKNNVQVVNTSSSSNFSLDELTRKLRSIV